MEEFLIKIAKYIGIPIGIFLILSIIFRVGFVTFVDNYEMGYEYNSMTGKMSALNRQGYILSVPFIINIHTIDLRPTQVCINANSRVLNCKLVQFDTAGWRTFIAWHGRSNYSNNGGTGSTDNLNTILMSYAYDGSGKSYPFLKILRELKPDDELKPIIKNDTINTK